MDLLFHGIVLIPTEVSAHALDVRIVDKGVGICLHHLHEFRHLANVDDRENDTVSLVGEHSAALHVRSAMLQIIEQLFSDLVRTLGNDLDLNRISGGGEDGLHDVFKNDQLNNRQKDTVQIPVDEEGQSHDRIACKADQTLHVSIGFLGLHRACNDIHTARASANLDHHTGSNTEKNAREDRRDQLVRLSYVLIEGNLLEEKQRARCDQNTTDRVKHIAFFQNKKKRGSL